MFTNICQWDVKNYVYQHLMLLPLLLPSLSCRLRRDGARTGEAAHVADSLHLATEKGGDFSFFW